jgi:Undecaprenyl-phosphate galactose phosphotransferase WbaP
MNDSFVLEKSSLIASNHEISNTITNDSSASSMIMPAHNDAENLLFVLPHIPMIWVEDVMQIDSTLTGRTREQANDFKDSLTRAIDIIAIMLAAPFAALVFLVIGALIALESKGGVFYGQTRIGKGGRKFKAYKFRTMIKNADQLLQSYLDNDPALKAEWEASHKLKNDPRVTRIGAVLRKFSLDELPQLWNILIGDMGLVGPRPIVDAEIEKYDRSFELYKQVRPGLTGLWQVSGRSDTSYERRVELDKFYILNWSLKLDIQIILRTVWVVVGKKGAY